MKIKNKNIFYFFLFVFVISTLLLFAYCFGYTDYFFKVIIPIIVALLAAYIGWRNWRLQHFTKEWSELIKYLYDKAEYMDPKNTNNYKTAFTGEKQIQYELIARLCISFIDDVYFLDYENTLDDWLKGSINLFVGRHWSWFQDNKDSYSEDFIKFVQDRINKEN